MLEVTGFGKHTQFMEINVTEGTQNREALMFSTSELDGKLNN